MHVVSRPNALKVAVFIGLVISIRFPLLAQQRAVSFGPLTLGKPLPVLPPCGPMDSEGNYKVQVACADKMDRGWVAGQDLFVRNVIADTDLNIVTSDCGAEDRWSCPVVQITAPIFESLCAKVLARLNGKFGTPTRRDVPLQNSFGARWMEHDYFWKFASGDLIYYATHPEIDGGNCYLEANTRAFRTTRDKKPEVNF